MKANLLAFRLTSFVLLAPNWKEFPLGLHSQAGIDGIGEAPGLRPEA